MVRRTIPMMAALGVAALVLGSGTQALAASTYEAQLEHGNANFSLTDGKAGGLTFETGAERLERFGAWIASQSSTGTVSASVRTDVEDPETEVASATADVGAVGGTGSGWLEFEFDVPLAETEEYTVVLQAHDTDANVVWYGNRSPVEGAIPSWNYDVGYWGGWVQYGVGDAERFANWNLAFYINDALTSTGCAGVNECWRHIPAAENQVNPAGLLGAPGNPYALSSFQVSGAEYVPGSSVLALPDGDWFYMPEDADAPAVVPEGDSGAAHQIAESQAWLDSGRVPGGDDPQRELATRALLDMRLLLQENGAAAAAWHGIWKYSWPRDTAFMAVAFARAGHLEEARRILTYNDETLRRTCDGRPDNCEPGTWDARTLLDGSGPPDERAWQLDANGFVPWAVWQYVEALPTAERADAIAGFYDMVRTAADVAAASLDDDGIPPARPDYWESAYPAPNLGTAAPLLAGLRASADLAVQAGELDDAERWYAAADRLADGIEATFGQNGYQRTIVDGSGKDSAITWLAPPFNAADRQMLSQIDETWDALLEPTGGVKPGEDWSGNESWTPETMFFALAWANTGDDERAADLVDWLQDHRTVIGAFPEKVTVEGYPAAVATLGWTASLAVLTLEALEEPLPVPPVTMPTEVTPEPVVFVDEPGTAADAVIVPEVGGVIYLLDGEPIAAGSHPGSGNVVVTAEPTEGFRFPPDATTRWEHQFDASGPTDDPTEPPATDEPTTEPTDQPTPAPSGTSGPPGTAGQDPNSSGGLPVTGLGAGAAVAAVILIGAGLLVRRHRGLGRSAA